MKNRHLANIIILLILSAVIYHGVFFPGIAARTDLFLPTQDWLKEHSQLQFWTFEGGGGPVAPYEFNAFPLYWIWNNLSEKFSLPLDLGRRLIWIYTFLIVGVSSMYYLAWYISKSLIASFISSLCFVGSIINIWAIHGSWIQGPAAMAFVPLSFVFFLKALDGNRKSKLVIFSLLSGIIFTIIIWYELKVTIMSMALLFSYYLFSIYKLKYKISKTTFSFILLFTVITLLNLWVILPFILGGISGVPTGATQSGNIVSQEILYSLNLILKPFTENGIVFLLLTTLISCLLFFSLILSSSSYVIYFSLLTLILITLSSGALGPLGFIYSFFYKNIPFFVAFRDPNKFALFLTFPVAILLGITAKEIDSKFVKKFFYKAKFLKIITVSIFSFIILGAVCPAFFGRSTLFKDKPGSVLRPKPMPEEMTFLYRWVKTQPEDYKMLLYPGAGPFQITSERHPGLGAFYYTSSPIKDLAKYFWMSPYGRSSVIKREYTGNLKEMLELLNIRHVVLYPDYEYMWNVVPGIDSQEKINEIFLNQAKFNRIESPSNLIIYENDKAQPLIYPVSKINLIIGGRDVFLPLLLFDFDFSGNCLLFNSQLQRDSLELWNNLDSILFYGKDLDDLALSTLENKYKIDLWNYAEFSNSKALTEQRPYSTWDTSDKGWVRYYSPYWLDSEGEIQEGRSPGLIQAGLSSADLYLDWKAPQDDLYEIWARIGVGHDIWQTKDMGEISFHLDYILFGFLNTRMENITGLKWLKIGEAYLTKGEHNLWIRNRVGMNSMDQLAVVPKDILVSHFDRLTSLLNQKSLIFMFEGEKHFFSKEPDWYIKFHSGKASQGFTFATQDRHTAIYLGDEENDKNASIWQLPSDGKYVIKLRILNTKRASDISVIIDSKNVYSQRLQPKEEFIWLETRPIYLKKGYHNFSIKKKDKGVFELDLILIYNNRDEFNSLFEDSVQNQLDPIRWNMLSPTDIKIELNKEAKFIVFNTNYNPYWEIKIAKDSNIYPIITNSWANGFLLKGITNNNISLNFELQYLLKISRKVSIIITTIIIVVCVYLFLYCLNKKRIKNSP